MLDQTAFALTAEQQFELRKLQIDIASLTQEEARDRLLEAANLLMLKDNMIRELLKRGTGT